MAMKNFVRAVTMAVLLCTGMPASAQQPDVSNDMEIGLFIQRCGSGALTGRCREIVAHTVANAAHYPGACPNNLPSDSVIVEAVWNYMKYRATNPLYRYDTVMLSVSDVLERDYYCSNPDM